jgi:alpha-1,2-glucosyltransferase
MPSLLQAWALPAALLAITNVAATWYQFIAEHVPDPYLVRRTAGCAFNKKY